MADHERRRQFLYLINTGHFGEVRQPDHTGQRALGLGFLQQRQGLCLDAATLLVNVGGEQPKTLVFELE